MKSVYVGANIWIWIKLVFYLLFCSEGFKVTILLDLEGEMHIMPLFNDSDLKVESRRPYGSKDNDCGRFHLCVWEVVQVHKKTTALNH